MNEKKGEENFENSRNNFSLGLESSRSLSKIHR